MRGRKSHKIRDAKGHETPGIEKAGAHTVVWRISTVALKGLVQMVHKQRMRVQQ
jgi:hypothetical protein